MAKRIQRIRCSRRLEAFTADAKIIQLTRRRVAFSPTAAAR